MQTSQDVLAQSLDTNIRHPNSNLFNSDIANNIRHDGSIAGTVRQVPRRENLGPRLDIRRVGLHLKYLSHDTISTVGENSNKLLFVRCNKFTTAGGLNSKLSYFDCTRNTVKVTLFPI